MKIAEHTRRALVPPLAGLGAFAVLAILWLAARPLFFAVETQWGIWPGAYPFSDLEVLLSGIECKRQGIDAWVVNPCDTFGRIFDYPPAWLWLSVFPVSTGWMNPAGIALSLAFFASLALLPPARTAQGSRLVALGVLSTTTLFAVERGNNDLAVFVLVLAGTWLLARRNEGLAGYALIFLAGLLKYFPMVAMALALKERPRRFLVLAGLSLALAALFAAAHHRELASAIGTIPHGSPFRLVFGASNLGGGLVLLGAPAWAGQALTAVLAFAGLTGGVALGLRREAGAAASPLSVPERLFFLAGALVVVGAFLTAQNVDYRAVHLLMALPTLIVLRETAAPRRYANLCWVALALLWMDFFRIKILAVAYLFEPPVQQLIEAIPGFLLREALWWWFVVHVVALATALLRDAPLPRLLAPRLRREPAPDEAAA